MKPLRLNAALATLALVLSAPAAATLSLSDALQKALVHDPEIREAAALYEAALEAGEQEKTSLRPGVAASANLSHARTESEGVFGATSDEYPSWSAGIEARQPLFRLDWMARGERASVRDQMAEVQAQQHRLQILQKVATRYFTALVAHDGVTQAEAEAAAVQQSLATTRKRHEVGLVPGNDLREAEARNDLAQAQVLSARHEMQSARESLDEITGAVDEPLPVLPENMVVTRLPAREAENWVRAAVGNNAEAKLARLELALAKTQTQSRRSEAAPTLDLVGRYGHEDTSEFRFGQKVDDARVILDLKVPIYAGGLNNSRLRESVAREQAAEAALQRISRQIERQSRQHYRDILDSEAQIAALNQVLVSARAAETAVRNGYDAGTRTISDVLDARSRVVQAQRQLGISRANLLVNLLELRRVTGGLSEKDFAEVDVILGLKKTVAEDKE